MPLVACHCGASFASVNLLHNHAVEEGHLLKCGCGCLFKTESGVDAHQKSAKCPGPKTVQQQAALQGYDPALEVVAGTSLKCEFCPNNKPFKDGSSLMQHKASKHPTCPMCKQAFHDDRSSTASSRFLHHQKSTGHCYCSEHNAAYGSTAAFAAHKRATPHVTGFQCVDCDREFGTQQGLSDHLAACPAKNKEVHVDSERAAATFVAVEEANLRCEEHDRTFRDLKAFRQHKESVQHKPVGNFTCNVKSDKCSQVFTSYSAWFLHIESDKCKSGMDKRALYELVHAGDKGALITFACNAPQAFSIRDVGLHADSSVTASRITDLDVEFDRLSISTHSDNGEIIPSDTCTSSPAIDGVVDPTADISDNGSDTVSVNSDTSRVLLTPSDSASRSRSSSTSGILLTPSASSNSCGEWSFVTDSHKLTPVTRSNSGSSDVTITYDNVHNVWPCNKCRRTFRKKSHLLQHIDSPAHAAKLFHCPVVPMDEVSVGKREKTFKTLSGLAQHVEAGACDSGVELLEKLTSSCQTGRIAGGTGQRRIEGAS